MLRQRALGIAAATLAAALMGCPQEDDQGAGRTGRIEDREDRGDRGDFTPAQALGVARTINTAEIDQATAVKDRLGAASPLSGMVDMIIRDHRESLQELERVSIELALVPEDSDEMRELATESQKTTGELLEVTGEDLEEKFVDVQVDMHEKALDVIDDDLLPAAKDPTLRAYLERLRATIDSHLTMARSMKEQLDDRGDRDAGAREGQGTQSENQEPSGHMEGRPQREGGVGTQEPAPGSQNPGYQGDGR